MNSYLKKLIIKSVAVFCKEAGLAGLYLAALEGNIENVTLQNAPVSYLFGNRDSVEFF